MIIKDSINLDKRKIAIVTTVAKFELYKKTATLFPKGIDKIVIDGSSGMYGIESIKFMFQKLKSSKYEWIIMADEDVFFYDANKVFELINYMSENNYDIAGVRDGGVIKHRTFNPMVINTFFSVINFKKVKEQYNLNEILSTKNVSPEIYTSIKHLNLLYPYDIENFKEPYYSFYFWMHKKSYNFLYLDTINPYKQDQIANVILLPDGQKLALHSWYARAYQVYEDQTIRLNEFIKDFNIDSEIDFRNVNLYRKTFFNFWKKIKTNVKGLFSK